VRPSGADNYLKWRRSIDEHLELRRLTWDEYAMFNWLCTKASPRTGTLRTSWPTLAEQTALSVNYAGKLCGSLKRKGYIAYPEHRGRRGRLVEVAIDKFPLADGTYTALVQDPGRSPSEVPAEVLAEVPAEVPAELGGQKAETTGTSPHRRKRKRQRKSSLRVRSADGVQPEKLLSKAEALAEAPPALRETLELYWFKTGRDALDPADLEHLHRLDEAHTPAVIQKAITRAVERFERRGQDKAALTLQYVWESLRHYTTRKRSGASSEVDPNPTYPTGVTRLW
jgi:hypothetical protein